MKTVLQLLKSEGRNPITMPKSLKTKWLKALRSGEYKQTTGTLYNEDADGYDNPGFCCLGVLQHCVTGGVEFDTSDYPREYPSDKWLSSWDIVDNDGLNVYYGKQMTNLADLNDHEGLSFKQIANIIEKQVIGV